MIHKWLKNWLSLAFWWVPREESAAKPQTRSEPSEAQPQAQRTSDLNAEPPKGDDLTVIKGIGPATQEKLSSLGVTSFADLADADPTRLTSDLRKYQPGISEKRVRSWIDTAKERANMWTQGSG